MSKDIEKRLIRIEAMLETLLMEYPAARAQQNSVKEQAAALRARGIDIADYLREKHRAESRLNRRKKKKAGSVGRNAGRDNS